VRAVEVLPGFPAEIRGRALLLPVDNLNTDGIYGKDVTYRDDLTPEQMAGHAMANYDPEFQGKAVMGDIIVAGRNFGTGSSREQAATALKYRGIEMVIAASFSQTYLRNAFNNAFICLESPALYEAVRAAATARVGAGEKTVVAGELTIDVRRSVAIFAGAEYPIGPLGPAAQELIMAGGLEALTRAKIAAV
jgi:homoaconitate hydratase